MNKPRVCIDFCDFSPHFPKTDNFYYHLLSERYEVRLCDQPDFLFFGPYGHEHRLHSGVRILLSIEPVPPDYSVCDYSLTCLKVDDPRHLQVPAYVPRCGDPGQVIKRQDNLEQILASKTKFCSFVASNPDPQLRADFFLKLDKRKRVDSGGRLLNNIGGPVPGYAKGKAAFLRPYKFNIAFENSALPGYTSEKIFDPMVARSVPIYWGNPLINEEFNPKSFLNRADFPSDEALIDKILELDGDDAKYLEYAKEPYFHRDEPNLYCSRERLLAFFERVFSEKIEPVARRRKSLLGRWLFVKRHRMQPGPRPAPAADGTSPGEPSI